VDATAQSAWPAASACLPGPNGQRGPYRGCRVAWGAGQGTVYPRIMHAYQTANVGPGPGKSLWMRSLSDSHPNFYRTK